MTGLKKALVLSAAIGAVVEVALITALSLQNRFPLFQAIQIFCGANVALVIVADIFFRTAYRFIAGHAYQFIPRVPFNKLYVEPHPYLPYVYKKHALALKQAKADYPLNKDKGFMYPPCVCNNVRHNDGPTGSRNVEMPKPKGQYRVLCLGGSTTGNYLSWQGKVYSYPMELEADLKRRFPDRDIVVHNCGQGGWSTAEILVDFLMNVYDTQPDLVVLYHAYNDLGISLTPGFKSDYSHARRNLGETMHLFRRWAMLPDLPIAFYNAIINKASPFGNPRFGIIQAVSRGKPDLNAEFQGLETYRRNIEHLVKVCKGSGIDMLLSTYVHYLYEDIRTSPVHLKYRDGVAKENEMMRAVASRLDVPLVDADKIFPREERYFVDSIHFSPEGMTRLAKDIGDGAASIISKSEAYAVQR